MARGAGESEGARLRICSDLHHEALFKSLRLLFEKRLGHTLLRPIGMEWFQAGYWGYPHHAEDTAAQFLGNAYDHPGLTLEEYCADPPQLLISSTPQQFEAWERLREWTCEAELPPVAHAFQSGNRWEIPAGVQNYLNSTTVPGPPGCNEVRYHQEFSTRDYYRPVVRPSKVISSFMHYASQQDNQLWFDTLRSELPEWRLNEYGAGGAQGQPSDLVIAMRETRYLYHPKRIEGYGFNVHYAAAMGIPLIMRVRANQHEAIGALLKPGRNCLDIDDYASPGHLADAIRRFDEHHEEASESIRAQFVANVDFDAEEGRIREWLANVR